MDNAVMLIMHTVLMSRLQFYHGTLQTLSSSLIGKIGYQLNLFMYLPIDSAMLTIFGVLLHREQIQIIGHQRHSILVILLEPVLIGIGQLNFQLIDFNTVIISVTFQSLIAQLTRFIYPHFMQMFCRKCIEIGRKCTDVLYVQKLLMQQNCRDLKRQQKSNKPHFHQMMCSIKLGFQYNPTLQQVYPRCRNTIGASVEDSFIQNDFNTHIICGNYIYQNPDLTLFQLTIPMISGVIVWSPCNSPPLLSQNYSLAESSKSPTSGSYFHQGKYCSL